jgi:hypothetical protein
LTLTARVAVGQKQLFLQVMGENVECAYIRPLGNVNNLGKELEPFKFNGF